MSKRSQALYTREREPNPKTQQTQGDPKGTVSVVIINNLTPGYLKAFVTKLMSD